MCTIILRNKIIKLFKFSGVYLHVLIQYYNRQLLFGFCSAKACAGVEDACISGRTTAVQSRALRGFPQTIQMNSAIVHRLACDRFHPSSQFVFRH